MTLFLEVAMKQSDTGWLENNFFSKTGTISPKKTAKSLNVFRNAGLVFIFSVLVILLKVKLFSLQKFNQILAVEKVREMSFGLPNMSDMLKDADQEIHSREVKRRRDEQAKVITADNQNSRK